MRKLDWEEKIIAICNRYKVNPDQYNKNDEFKEIVASMLGFPSFQSFQAFPNPRGVISGISNPLKPEHIIFATLLVEDCCYEINRNFFYDQNADRRAAQIDNLIQYILSNLPHQKVICIAALSIIIRDISDYNIQKSKYWSKIPNSYKKLLFTIII